MFLKRLESVGFKSFAERIHMDFVPGVTAVVGPNGSGKSNIIDGIRWVLGEQSAKSLRGQKMEDIIFQGSETRKALNFAEVSLILNNEAAQLPIDYQEVNVTRRVYRSGESEFFINKQPCRLKDIIDLFMDTGLGRESFSIIGQGRIDEILSSKAEERRAVFEEAAGVLKYKQRKQKAEYKLEETTDNLDRVEDIIYEIEQQMEPLQKQATTAETFNTFKSKLQEVEVALLVTEIEQLLQKWESILKDIEHDQNHEMEQRTMIQEKEANMAEERNKAHHLDEKITQLQNQLLTITEQLEQYEGKRNVLYERTKHMTENKQKLENESKVYAGRIGEVEETIGEEKRHLSDIKESIRSLSEKTEALESQLLSGVEKLEARIEDKKSDFIEFLNQQAVLQNEVKSIEKQLQQIDYQLEQNKSRHNKTFEEEKQIKREKETLTKRLQYLKKNGVTTRKQLDELKANIEHERNRYESMQKKLFTGNEKIATIQSRKVMLEEMRDSYQGFFFGVKEILKAKQQKHLTDILGAVVDLIEIPSRYITAIDTVLGAQSQYIVVEDDSIARNTIQWLKANNKGRATFLPLQSITSKNIPSDIQEQLTHAKGFISIASKLIQVEPKYKKIADYLLGNVIITENLKSANEIAKMTKRKFRIVTLDGDMVYPGGSMSGGAKRKQQTSLFSREKELEQLTATLFDYEKRAHQYQKKIENQKQTVQRLENEKVEKEVSMESLKEDMNHLQGKLQKILLENNRIKDQLKSDHFVSEQLQSERNELHNQVENVKKQQQTLKVELTETESIIDQLTKEKDHFETNRKHVEDQLHELAITKTEQMERKKHHEYQLSTLYKQWDEYTSELQQTNNQLEMIMDEEERKIAENEINSQIEALKHQRNELTDALAERRNERTKLVKKTEDEEHEIKGLNQALDLFKKELQQKEVQANRLDVLLENTLQTLQSEYRMTYERASESVEKVDDIEGARQKVSELKTVIERLGHVNLGAIDEYARLTDRYSFLQEQQADLLKAQQTLYDVISEMDEEMKRRFSEVFSEIQDAFTKVFKQLFDGGHAELTLTNPKDLLETGIEIEARPPGKKLKTLGLLSGGERALTAIALLFAILRVRPVPFCILDEVDAALDEANVERFGNYLQTFSHDTQFIVITHRKGTMEEADALYGITMQESGVSRLVSVKLEEAAHAVGVS